MLTARDDAESRITGLEIGADDYLSKPFEPRELSLRIANILKRAQPAAAPPVGVGALRAVRVSSRRAANCARGDDVIRLTDREREMLRVLAATPGETVPRMALAGNGGTVSERAVDVQVNRLRRKIERDPANPLYRADRARHRLPAGDRRHDQPRHRHRRDLRHRRGCASARRPRVVPTAATAALQRAGSTACMPKGLYARALLIIIAPMVILQSVVAFVFMERHWNVGDAASVRRRGAGHRGADRHLPAAIRRTPTTRRSARIAQDRLGLAVDFLPRRRHAAAGTEAVLLAARPGAVGGDCASRSAGRSGSTPSAARRWSKSASSSTTR